ncbi:MAG: hypothetical protein U9R19_17255 [Bacteroidota bacterium]|nr:hypothetical protein [Bacteroidota bacterium]
MALPIPQSLHKPQPETGRIWNLIPKYSDGITVHNWKDLSNIFR